ncbi:MAG: phospholipase D-like domain-containing protein [Candidatus Aenigmatarchaeota archaeon]
MKFLEVGNIKIGKIGYILEKELKNCNEAIIFSPFISPYFAEFLLKISKKAKVKLITSNERELNHRIALSKLIKKELNFLGKILVIFSAISLVFMFLDFSFLFLSLAFFIFSRFFVKEKKLIDITVLDKKKIFIHAKFYFIDKKLFISTANFTKSGFFNNVEALVEINDEKTVNEIKKYLFNIMPR